MSNDKIDKILDDVNDLKIVAARQEINMENITKILDRLTSSVEEHVKRSDNFEKSLALVSQDLQNKKDRDLLVVGVLGTLGAIFLFLKQLGILDKLF